MKVKTCQQIIFNNKTIKKLQISSFFSFSDKDVHYIEADVLMGTLQNADSDR